MLQALHGIKSSRVTSKSTDVNIAHKHQQKTAKTAQTKAPSDANPPSQDWGPSKKRQGKGAKQCQRGKPALRTIIDKIKSNLYSQKSNLVNHQGSQKEHRPRRSKTCIRASHLQRTSSCVSETDEKWVPAGQASTNLQPREKKSN